MQGLGTSVNIEEISKYIKYALESNEKDIAKIACGIISDMSSNMQGRLSDYLADFVPLLLNILKNDKVDRKMKLPAFHALGDLSLN